MAPNCVRHIKYIYSMIALVFHSFPLLRYSAILNEIESMHLKKSSIKSSSLNSIANISLKRIIKFIVPIESIINSH